VIELGRLLLAGLFAVAGGAKLADRKGSLRALRDFAVPERLAPPLAFLLPIVELGIAAALLPGVSARVAAAAAAGLLVLFSIGATIALLRGRRPDCHCFGRLHSAPVGPATLARNVTLAAGAAALAVYGPGTSFAAVDPLAAVGTVAVALLVVESLVLVALLRRHGHVLVQLDELASPVPAEVGLEIGTPAPPFALPSARGELVTLRDLLAPGRPLLLTFIDPGCGPCAALLPVLAGWQNENAHRLTVATIGRGDMEANRAAAEEHGLDLLLDGGDVTPAYGSAGTPCAVLVDPEGRVASSLRCGADGIRALIGDELDLGLEEVLVHA
jgi:uncharacterized membrane protein YphA (DoxX/SURF4 family)/peroxiredoxin